MTTTEPEAVNRWAAEFADAVQRAGGRLGTHDRIPREAVERALAASSTSAPTGPALLGFLRSPVTWVESVVAPAAALLALGRAGFTTQRHQAPACPP